MDQTILEKMGGSAETIKEALKLVRQAKTRTRPGSGHEMGEYATGLIPICGLLASESLNNGDITKNAAQPASCLNNVQFKKAYQILKAALQDTKSTNNRVSCENLIEKYVVHSLLARQLEQYCQEGLAELKKQGMNAVHIKSNNVVCGMFLWVCGAAKIANLPTTDDLASEFGVSPRPLQDFINRLTKDFSGLKRKIAQESRSKASATPSPTKAPTGVTPRRTVARRLLLAKHNPTPQRLEAEVDEDDDDTPLPETPTKKRRIDNSPDLSGQKTSLFEATIRGSTSRVALDDVRARPTRAVGQGSPLKQATSLPQGDAQMAEPDSSSESEDEGPKAFSFRRFRPAYLEQKQWNARDPRLKRIWKLREQQKQKFVELYGDPFSQS
ncbi:hypothetical protein FA15DRAFT_698233 [Coprinopsis marcescibilis]|uniref:Origin recognition complex subunit 6 n=1 Tax=Coprinopsis marcescibilis TaxID=230819 RepID=A0A5C3KDK0_COPMA|nr:hypothetical protein FA15DRAFT_698233 [Coprinopsis marcescibilis]